jgi:hypothetical protein
MNNFVSQFDKPFMEKQPVHISLQLAQKIKELIHELEDVAPALTDQHKIQIYDIVGAIGDEGHGSLIARNDDPFFGGGSSGSVGVLDIDAITSQYLIVEHIRNKILDPTGTIKHKATPRELTALVSAISNVVSLFLKNQDKLTLLKEVQRIKRSVSLALADAPLDVKTKFLEKVKEGQD